MALVDSLRRWLGVGTQFEDVSMYTPSVAQILGMGPEDLYRTQPHLRTVVAFLARNIAQLPLHVFERVSDTDRRRVTGDPVAELFSRPNEHQTWFELMFATVTELKLYDWALWVVAPAPNEPSGWVIQLVPSSWVSGTGGGSEWAPAWVQVSRPSGQVMVLQRPDFLTFHGYRPGEPSRGLSPVDALQDILAEQIHAWSYRQQVWSRGGRVGTYITRPKDAPWSDEARTKFSRDWAAKWTGRGGPKAGGTPLFEDGMELKSVRFNAREEQWSEVAKLALATVASVYHTNPTMVGILDDANFSNVREFARMLYTDTLGPDLAMFEQRINAFILPRLTNRKMYVEFAIQAKMAGSFEEQASVLSTSVGAPWMSRNEARARLNMPRIDEGDEIITPLNVLVGGQASPQDGVTTGGGAPLMSGDDLKQRIDAAAALIRSGFDPAGALVAVGLDPIKHLGLLHVTVQKPIEPAEGVDESLVDEITGDTGAPKSRAAAVKVKAEGREADAEASATVLRRFFKRQASVVLSGLGAKDADWWDGDRWDRELADDLQDLAMTASAELGADALARVGLSPDRYDAARTVKFLRAVSESRAKMLNAKTLDQLTAALDGDLEEGAEKATPEGVFAEAEGSRAEQAGGTFATALAGFATVEAMRQVGRGGVTKTWLTTSANPRPSHAAMNGETVGLDEAYSNGMDWPGDISGAGGDAGEISNCSCVSELTIP